MRKTIFVVLFLIFGILPFIDSTKALQEGSIRAFDAEYVIQKDSTVLVKEKITYHFNGLFHTIFRAIPLTNPESQGKCLNSVVFQCGGFDWIAINGAKDINGNPINPDTYSINKEMIDGFDNIVFTLNFGDAGRNFNNEDFYIEIDYKVYGSIGYDVEKNINYFYWNTNPIIDLTITNLSTKFYFPENFKFDDALFSVPQPETGPSQIYDKKYYASEHMLQITSNKFDANEYLTVEIGIPLDVVDKPGILKFDSKTPSEFAVTFGDGLKLEGTDFDDVIRGMPTGDIELELKAYGYNNKTINVSLTSGETETLEIQMQETFFALIMRVLFYALTCIGMIFMPIVIWLVYKHWVDKGRDANQVKVVIPYYKPPEDVRPYLLGTLKDEKVDLIDITSTIVDTAYRGYIKIKELEGASILGISIGNKDYELNKIKDFETLNASEQLIMNGVFDYKERVTISSLQNKFYKKLPGLRDAIYDEMKTKGYYMSRPDEVRRNYLIIGVVILIIGGALLSFNGFIAVIFMYPLLITISLAIVLLGLSIMVISPFMPARTTHGSKVYEQLLGFRMYMDVAERFRVQDLTPETFEKYLSYAMIFGIEKKWGDRFKDICKASPEWFESSSDTWTTLYMINSLNAFHTTTASALSSVPQANGSGTSGRGFGGGGWSGGGGFSGGFSGGGGGGGSTGWS